MFGVGHREARAYKPENTLRSFKKDIELGADAVKPDVRRTKDDEIGVVHDVEADRPTNGKGLMRELTLNDVKQLEVI